MPMRKWLHLSLLRVLSLPPSPTWSETSHVHWRKGTTSGKHFKNMQPSLTLASVRHVLIMAARGSLAQNVCVCARVAPMARTVRSDLRITSLVSVRDWLWGRCLSHSEIYSRLTNLSKMKLTNNLHLINKLPKIRFPKVNNAGLCCNLWAAWHWENYVTCPIYNVLIRKMRLILLLEGWSMCVCLNIIKNS